jgi:hypothetical protein
MPNNPTNPPTGTYNSTCGADFSSWDGSFTYTETTKTITYTLNGQTTALPSTTNMDSGNAIHFELTDPNITPNTVEFKASNFKWEGPDNMAEYKGTCTTKGPVANPDSWTATQTS